MANLISLEKRQDALEKEMQEQRRRLESSQTTEPKESIATCGAVAQYASGTGTTGAQGLEHPRRRKINISSKQGGVLRSNLSHECNGNQMQVFIISPGRAFFV